MNKFSKILSPVISVLCLLAIAAGLFANSAGGFSFFFMAGLIVYALPVLSILLVVYILISRTKHTAISRLPVVAFFLTLAAYLVLSIRIFGKS